MSSIVKRGSIYLALASMVLTLALAGPAAAANSVRFHGSILGAEVDHVQGTTLTGTGTGTGIATLLGRFTVTWEVTVNLVNGSAVGSFHFITAAGDSLSTSFRGQGNPTNTPGVNQIVEVNIIAGGTGRFEGASGSFILERLIDLPTGFTAGSFIGSIRLTP